LEVHYAITVQPFFKILRLIDKTICKRKKNSITKIEPFFKNSGKRTVGELVYALFISF
jgi:hypothetical protein